MPKRLAITKDGKLTYCTASEENIGKGRCNHIAHQKMGESNLEFMEALSAIEAPLLNDPDDISLSVPIISETDDGIMEIPSYFGLKNALGINIKGPIILNDGSHLSMKYLKVDELNPAHGLHRTNNKYDYTHPAISETIVSAFIKNVENADHMHSVLYDLSLVQYGNKTMTATISDNFVEEGYMEQCITQPDGRHYEVDIKEYEKCVCDNINHESLLMSLNEFYQRASDSEDDFRSFIVSQGAFDLLMGNSDRKGNPGNHVFIKSNADGKVKPINLDYGICLPTFWTETTENRKPDDALLDDIANDCADNVRNGGVFAPILDSDLPKSVDFLLDHGFEPFKVNVQKMNEDLDAICNQMKGTPFEFYTKCKVAVLKKRIQQKEMKRLWREI